MSTNKVCVITGANSGIGKVTATELAKQGYEIVMIGRDSQKSRDAADEIIRDSGSDSLRLVYANLASLASIRSAAEEIHAHYQHIDLLINNAGVFKRKEEMSEDGFEMTIAVNYIAPFYLTHLLLPLVKKSLSARILNVSSELYKGGKVYLDGRFSAPKFDGTKAYSNSKLLLIYFTKHLAQQLEGSNITVNALHPGVIATDVFREMPALVSKLLGLFISKPQKGAEPSLYLATSEEVKNVSGKYFNKTTQADTVAAANDDALQKKIISKTEELLGMAS